MKNKKIIIGVSIMCVIVISITLILITNKSSSKVLNNNLDNNNIENKVPGMFAIMLETERGSGKYEQSTSGLWPGSGYMFNETLSTCENGGTLTWNEENRTVNLKSNLSDKCYLYFDIVPPDLTIAKTNTGYGSAPATLNCSNATAEYNQKYNRIEISQINRPNQQTYGSCNLTYQTPSSTTYLNNYIIGLSGTEQGTGQVVNEGSGTYPDYSSATTINQTQYGTPTTYSSSSYSSTSGTTTSGTFTFSDNNWTSVPSSMTSGTYYHIRVTPQTAGYYQICYDVSTGNSSNRLYAYVNTTNQYLGGSTYVSASTMTTKSGCQSLGYLSTSDTVRVVQRAYSSSSSSIATTSFRLERFTSTYELNLGIRYEGKDPNNYIWFNNELWRIIGVFDEATHGVSGQNLVKIIRVGSIGGLAWDKNGENDWSQASLMNLLNGVYLNSQNGTGGEYCYGYSTIVGAQCDYTETGINDTYRPMIENVTWYLGGYSSTSATTEAFYGYERGTTVYSGRPTTTTGYIGLMYPSDYGYSVLSSSCARTTNLGDYDSAACAGQSWLYGQGYEWTITPRSSSSNSVFNLRSCGDLYNSSASSGSPARPVLYLDSSAYVIDGNGSQSDPYIIGM